MEKKKKKNKITNKLKSLKKSKSLKGFSKTYFLIGLVLLIAVGIALYLNYSNNTTLIIVIAVIGFFNFWYKVILR